MSVQDAMLAVDRLPARWSPEALPILQPWIGKNTEPPFLSYLVNAYVGHRDYLSAQSLVDQLLLLHSGHPSALATAGMLSAHREDFTKANDFYERAIALFPDNAELRNDFACVLESQQRDEDAERLLREAVKCDPTLTTAWENLGRIAQVRGDLEQAKHEYRDGITKGASREILEDLLTKIGYYMPMPWDDALRSTPDDGERVLSLQLIEALRPFLPTDRRITIVDLHCGTGLVGLAFSKQAKAIVGVDSRVNLLQTAQLMRVYYGLQHTPPMSYLDNLPRETAQLMVANNIFMEHSDLLQAWVNISIGMAKHSTLGIVFPTHISADHVGYSLTQGWFYSHSSAYMEQRANFEGFTLKEKRDLTPAMYHTLDHAFTLMVFVR